MKSIEEVVSLDLIVEWIKEQLIRDYNNFQEFAIDVITENPKHLVYSKLLKLDFYVRNDIAIVLEGKLNVDVRDDFDNLAHFDLYEIHFFNDIAEFEYDFSDKIVDFLREALYKFDL